VCVRVLCCACVCVRACVHTMETGGSLVLDVYVNVSRHMLLGASRKSFGCVASLHEF